MNKLWASDLRNPLFIPAKGLQVTCCKMKISQQVFTKDGWLIWNQVDYCNIFLGLSWSICLPILCSFHMSIYLPTLFYRSYYPSTSRSISISFVFFPFVWFPIFLIFLSACLSVNLDLSFFYIYRFFSFLPIFLMFPCLSYLKLRDLLFCIFLCDTVYRFAYLIYLVHMIYPILYSSCFSI